MAFNIQEIRSRLALGGARPTLFQVLLDAPAGFDRELASIAPFMIQASSLPGSTLAPIEVPYFGRKIRVAGDRTFDPWTVTVINDEDFKIRTALELWMNGISKLDNNTGATNPTSYMTSAVVHQLGRGGSNSMTKSTSNLSVIIKKFRTLTIFLDERAFF